MDGNFVTSLKNDEVIKIEIDEEEHEVVVFNNDLKGNKFIISSGSDDVVLYLNYLLESFRLSNESDEEYATDEALDEKNFYDNSYTESPTKSVLCASIIAAALIIFSIIMYTNQTTNIIGFLLALVCTTVFFLSMIIGGFWIIVIPLPFISIWKAGSVKSMQSMIRMIGLAVLAMISFLGVFFSIFM